MKLPILLLAVASLVTLARPVAAQADGPSSRATLTGLPGFWVAIEEMDTAAARVGLTATVLQTDVENRLRAKGIRLFNREDFTNRLDVPQMYVNVNEFALHGSNAGLFTYNSTVEIRQAVKLSRDPSITSTTVTWRATPDVGTVGSDNFYIAVRDLVRRQVDQLMTAFETANPNR